MLVAMDTSGPDYDTTQSSPDPEGEPEQGEDTPTPARDPFEEEQVDPEVEDPDEAAGAAGV
jgi:hypothetical protein